MSGPPLTEALKSALADVARALVKAKGPVSFYGVVKRPEATRWDLVLAAPWVRYEDRETRDEIADCLKRHLSEDELLALRGTFVVDPEEPLCEALTGTAETNGTWHELEEERLVELEMVEAHVLCSCGPVKPITRRPSTPTISRRKISARARLNRRGATGGPVVRPKRSGRIGRRRP